jgi:hypothetical protein
MLLEAISQTSAIRSERKGALRPSRFFPPRTMRTTPSSARSRRTRGEEGSTQHSVYPITDVSSGVLVFAGEDTALLVSWLRILEAPKAPESMGKGDFFRSHEATTVRSDRDVTTPKSCEARRFPSVY